MSDVLKFNVTFGLQAGIHTSIGGTGGGAQLQGWRVGKIAISGSAAELTMSDAELSGELSFTVFGHGGGIKGDLLAEGPKITGKTTAGSGGVGSERTQYHKRGAKSKIGANVGLGFELEIDWKAAYEVAKRAIETTSTPSGGKK